MATPTLINLPEPPSNPDTPTEAPGTPNSTTTSLSALSTTAIKDGHRGAAFPQFPGSSHHHHTPSSNTLEAERADRISRLAGLERVSTVRASSSTNPGGAQGNTSSPASGQIPGYFDAAGNPVYTTRMSTVGSASATGSSGGRTTTWASGSVKGAATEGTEGDEEERPEGEEDRMSMDGNYREMDAERDRFSVSASAMDEDLENDGDAMSDQASLVGFGEGAGSTVSGPTYSTSRTNLTASPAVGGPRSSLNTQILGLQQQRDSGPGTPLSDRTTATADQQRREARMLDGVALDNSGGFVDTTVRSPVPVGGSASNLHAMSSGGGGARPTSGLGAEAAERIVDERLEKGEGDGNAAKPPLGPPKADDLGRFYFEEKK